MDDMDLDDEILAVTQPSGKSKEKDYSDRSDSDANDSDVPASDAEDEDDESEAGYDDDDRDDDDEDMEDDEPEEEDDDDDDDYSIGSKKTKKKKPTKKTATKKKGRTAPKKSAAKRKPPSKKKSSGSQRTGIKVNLNDIEDDDEEVFEFMYDEHGYGDAADREKLARMNEVPRETLLEERIAKRNNAYGLWKKEREMAKRERGKRTENVDSKGGQRRSNRSKVNSKSAAMTDMLDKEKQRLGDISDADSEPDRKRDRDRSSPKQGASDEKQSRDSPDDLKDEPDSGPDLQYSDIVTEGTSNNTTTPLFARRETLIYLSQKPAFSRAIEGLLVRVRVGSSDDSYLLCRVVGVERGKVYAPVPRTPNIRTDCRLLLQSGNQRKLFHLSIVSDSHPSRSEFETYRNRLLKAGGRLYSREEVNKLLKKAHEHIVKRKPKVDEAERKEHRAIMEKLYPEKVNWTVKRTEVQTALEVKQQDYEYELRKGNREEAEKLLAEVEQYTQELREVQGMEMKYVRKSASSSAKIFQELAAKNRVENMNMERLASTQMKRSGTGNESRVNPYARFDTTGQSYFSMGKKGDQNAGPEPSVNELRNDWKASLKTWKFGEEKKSISGTPIKEQYAVPIPGLHDLVWPPKPEWIKPVTGKRPPGIDFVYAARFEKKVKLPDAAKLISFEEWNRERQ